MILLGFLIGHKRDYYKKFMYQILILRVLDLILKRLITIKLANRLYMCKKSIIQYYLSNLILFDNLDNFLEIVFLLKTPLVTDLCISG